MAYGGFGHGEDNPATIRRAIVGIGRSGRSGRRGPGGRRSVGSAGSRPVLDWIDQCEKAGSRVRRAAEFRDAWREVSLMSLDVDRARQAIDSLDRGEGIPFDQAMHGLRNRLR